MLRLFLLPALLGLAAAASVHDHRTLLQDEGPAPPSPPSPPDYGPANVLLDIYRVDQCFPGLIENATVTSAAIDGAPATTVDAANGLLAPWVRNARAAMPQCYTDTGYPTDIRVPSSIVSRAAATTRDGVNVRAAQRARVRIIGERSEPVTLRRKRKKRGAFV